MRTAAPARKKLWTEFPIGDFSTLMASIAERADEAERDPAGLTVEIAALAEAGLLAACLPVDRGGTGLGIDSRTAARVFTLLRELGRANLSVGRLFEGHINAIKLIELYAAPAWKECAFDAVAEGALLGVWGADGRRPLRFSRVGDGIRLDGEKQFASGLGLVRFAIVTMRAGEQRGGPPQLALLDVSDPARQDPAAWTATGMRATLSGRYDFSGITIDSAQCIGRPGDYEREPHFEGGVWRYCAVHLGGAEALVELWRQALAARGRLDDPFQIARFARANGLCRAMYHFLLTTSQTVEQAAVSNEAAIEAAVADALLARQFTEDCCVEILALAEKSLGTSAHMVGSLERMRRDLSLFIRQAAPDAKLLKAGRHLLGAHSTARSW